MNAIRRASAHQQRRVRKCAADTDSYTFFNLLTSPDLLDSVEALLPAHRERLFPPTETLSLFLAQVLSADRSCQNAVNTTAMRRLADHLPLCSSRTGGYCRARCRLPEPLVAELGRHTGRLMSDKAPPAWHWRGRPVRLVDGTTLTMPDTAANQVAWPQPRSQAPGLGFPLCRLVAISCLGSGALLDAAIGRYHGKGGDEQSLLRTLLDTLNADDVLVGDAYYATYFMLTALIARGVDAVFEQHGARRRSTDFRRGQRLGPRDHLITLKKPKRKPEWMSQAEYAQVPGTLTVRELKARGKVLMTTLLDAKQTPKNALKALYHDRWQIELDLRNLKTTLGMDRLSCRTPAMVRKEIRVYLLAYNLIRLMMAQAASLADTLPRQLSFKHTVQLWHAWRAHRPDDISIFFVLIVQQPVGNRPGRIEPRAVKRRPNEYPRLMKPRSAAREQVRKHGHPKKVK